jgi:hypothetical protein
MQMALRKQDERVWIYFVQRRKKLWIVCNAERHFGDLSDYWRMETDFAVGKV